jgi:hypothetical protein
MDNSLIKALPLTLPVKAIIMGKLFKKQRLFVLKDGFKGCA